VETVHASGVINRKDFHKGIANCNENKFPKISVMFGLENSELFNRHKGWWLPWGCMV
jgi:hypothetical protein